MINYVFDGSFEGLLTSIYEAYYRKQNPQKILSSVNLQCNFLDEYVYIHTDTVKFNKVYQSIMNKISHQCLENIYHVFLSDDVEAGTTIFNYLKLGWKLGSKIEYYLTDDRVLKVHSISQRVDRERHKLLGFVRFSLLEGNIYYAPLSPDNNIVELLAPHFAERLSDQNWIIHDVKRNIAAVYYPREWLLVNASLDIIPSPQEQEFEYRKLWKEFFNSIVIQGRFNPKLQKKLMPVRYWRYMTEKL